MKCLPLTLVPLCAATTGKNKEWFEGKHIHPRSRFNFTSPLCDAHSRFILLIKCNRMQIYGMALALRAAKGFRSLKGFGSNPSNWILQEDWMFRRSWRNLLFLSLYMLVPYAKSNTNQINKANPKRRWDFRYMAKWVNNKDKKNCHIFCNYGK